MFQGECLNGNKPFDVGAGSNYDSNTGISTDFLPLQYRVNCAGSAALVEVWPETNEPVGVVMEQLCRDVNGNDIRRSDSMRTPDTLPLRQTSRLSSQSFMHEYNLL